MLTRSKGCFSCRTRITTSKINFSCASTRFKHRKTNFVFWDFSSFQGSIHILCEIGLHLHPKQSQFSEHALQCLTIQILVIFVSFIVACFSFKIIQHIFDSKQRKIFSDLYDRLLVCCLWKFWRFFLPNWREQNERHLKCQVEGAYICR